MINPGDIVKVRFARRIWTSYSIKTEQCYTPKLNDYGVVLSVVVLGSQVRCMLQMNFGEIFIFSNHINSMSKNYLLITPTDPN